MDKVEEILADIKAFVNAQVEGLTPNEQAEVYESLIADLMAGGQELRFRHLDRQGR